MKKFLQIKFLFFALFFAVFFLTGIKETMAASATISSFSPPLGEGFLTSKTFYVFVSSSGCSSIRVTVNDANCPVDGDISNKFKCTGNEGDNVIRAICGGGTNDTKSIPIDSTGPTVGSPTLTPVENKGSSVPDKFVPSIKVIAGTVIIETSIKDRAHGGVGVKNVKVYLGTSGFKKETMIPTGCDPNSFKLLDRISPNPLETEGTYKWTWDTTKKNPDGTILRDDRYYCLLIAATDKLDRSASNGTGLIFVLNNSCDKDNDGFIDAKLPLNMRNGCVNVVCYAFTDTWCVSQQDCDDSPYPFGGVFAKPCWDEENCYTEILQKAESLQGNRSFYLPTCKAAQTSCSGCDPNVYNCTEYCNGCPACDDNLDNDCDGNTDVLPTTPSLTNLSDSNCVETCDKDGDSFFNIQCLRPEHWEQYGDCNDSDIIINFGFRESLSVEKCRKIGCCFDNKDNCCNGKKDYTQESGCSIANCDKDGDGFLANNCSPDSEYRSSVSLPKGYQNDQNRSYLGWGDTNDNDPNVYPSTKKETEFENGCNGTKDNNSDGIQDKDDSDCKALCDGDNDGYFSYYKQGEKTHKAGSLLHENLALKICGDGSTCGGMGCDCDDSSKDVNSGIIEKTNSQCADNLDNDCDGTTDADDSSCGEITTLNKGIVPCGGPGQPRCTICHFFLLLQKILDFIRNLAFIVAPILIVACGVMFIVAAGNVNLLQRAKQGLIATVVGIAIILLAWVIVTLIFKAVGTTEEGRPWYKIECPTE